MPLLNDLQSSGFSAGEISDYLAAERSKLSAAGFDNGEINAEFGVKTFQESPTRNHADQGQAVAAGHAAAAIDRPPAPDVAAKPAAGGVAQFTAAVAAKAGLDETATRSLTEIAAGYAEDISAGAAGAENAFGLGFQQSVSGLIIRGKLPEDPGHNMSSLQRIMFQIGALTGDAPAYLAGGFIGTAGGPLDPLTVPASAMALTAGMRKALMQAYKDGSVTSWRDFFERSLATTWATVKGGITGAAVGKAGELVPGLAKIPAELTAMVTVGAALDGRVPDPQEFIDAAIVLGGLHAVGVVVPKLREIFTKTGRRPADVANDAANAADPAQGADIRAHVAEGRPGLPKAYQAEATRQDAARSATLAGAIDGLKSAMADPLKFDALQKARPEIRDLGQVQVMLENLQAEKAALSTSETPPAAPGKVDIAAGEAVRAKVGLDPGLTEPRLEPGVNKAVVSAAEELLISGEVVRDPSRLISDQIAELLQTGRIEPEQYTEILARHGVSANDFAQLWRADVRKSAQHLAMLSTVEANVRRMLGSASEEDLKILRQQGLDRNAETMSLWRRLDNLRRGILVTQLATAVRNFEVQVGRVGIDVLQRGLDAAIQRVLPEARRTVHPADVFAVVLRAFSPKNTKGMADQILSRFPKENDALFLRYSSDLTKAGKGTDAMAKAEKAVWILNAMNRFQEFAVRRPVFIAELDRLMALRGQNLEKIIAANKIGEISRDDIKGAINQALEITFAKDFNPTAKGAEGIAGAFIRLINKLPGLATIPFPFPRFLMNAIKFQYEFSPLGFLKLMSKNERAKIAGGNTGAISRAAIGTAMLFAAWQIRNSKYAGEKWWEIRLPSGETVSMLPFNPFVFNLFVADVVKRLQDGTLVSLTTKDLAFGFLSSNFRAGAGLFVLDKLINGLTGLGNEDKALKVLQGMAGSVASGFMVPLQPISDVYTQFDTWLGSGSEAVIRDNRDRPFSGQIIARIPGLNQTLPAAVSSTRSAPIRRRLPLLRQLTGLSIREAKNPAERELDRLGFTPQEISPRVGDPVADREIAKHLGPLVEATITPLVQAPFYLDQSNEVKSGLLREVLLGLRKMAIDAARAEDPARFQKIRVLGMPRRRRRMIESLTGINLGDLFSKIGKAADRQKRSTK